MENITPDEARSERTILCTPGGERHPAVIVSLMHAVGNGAIVKQRSKHVLHRRRSTASKPCTLRNVSC